MSKEGKYIKKIFLPNPNSRKGENGRVLVIGGSRLFHAASFWSAAMASKIVDMVHFSSPAMENNELMRVRAKAKFWEGIVVSWEDVEHYIEEDDAILIGPGMERGGETRQIVDTLLAKYPNKRWVVDGGALQEVDTALLTEIMIVTPNYHELHKLCIKTGIKNYEARIKKNRTEVMNVLSRELGEVTILSKGPVDVISDGRETVEVEGGNAGLTKGGTGDVLAGAVVGLYARSGAMVSCVVASRANKRAAEAIAKRVATYYGAGELIPELQRQLSDFKIGL